MNEYQIQAIVYQEIISGDSTIPDDKTDYVTKHVDYVLAPSPIQALRKTGLPQISEQQTLVVKLIIMPEELRINKE